MKPGCPLRSCPLKLRLGIPLSPTHPRPWRGFIFSLPATPLTSPSWLDSLQGWTFISGRTTVLKANSSPPLSPPQLLPVPVLLHSHGSQGEGSLFIFPQFWRLEVQDQDVGPVVFSKAALRLQMPSLHPVAAFLHGRCSVYVHPGVSSSSYKDTNHIGVGPTLIASS